MKIYKILFCLLIFLNIVYSQVSVSYKPVLWFNGDVFYNGKYFSIAHQNEVFKNITGLDVVIDYITSSTIATPVIFCNDAGRAKTSMFRMQVVYSGILTNSDNENTPIVDSLEIIINNSGIDTVYLIYFDKNLSKFDILDNSTNVYVNGALWSEVANFNSSASGAHHYVLDKDKGIFLFGGGNAAQLTTTDVKIETYLLYEDSSAVSNTLTSINGSFNYLKSISIVPQDTGTVDNSNVNVYLADRIGPTNTLLSDILKVDNVDYESELSTLTPSSNDYRYRSYIDTTEDIYFIGSTNHNDVMGFICDRSKKRVLIINGNADSDGKLSFAGPQTYNGTLRGGVANQSFYINESPYGEYAKLDSITVYVGSELFTQVDDLEKYDSTAKVYTFDRFSSRVLFGNGIHGWVPPADSTLTIKSYVSVDIFQYDSSYAASHSMPVIKIPRAVAARRNNLTGYIDVYIADSIGIHKFYLTGDTLGAYRLNYLYTFADSMVILDLDIFRYQKYNTSTVDYADVYLYAIDSISGVVKVFNDVGALDPSLDLEPILIKEIGEPSDGTDITVGKLYKPRAISVCKGEIGLDKVDVYVADTSSSGARITKFQGIINSLPEINYITPDAPYDTADILIAPHSTFRIYYSIKDDNLSNCTMKLYFDPDTNNSEIVLSGDEILIDSSINPTKGYYTWKISNTLSAFPDTGYIWALVKDDYGQEVAKYSKYRLIINDTNLTTFAIVDGLDFDNRIIVNNFSQNREIAFYLKKPDDIVSLNLKGYIDTSHYRVVSISQGPIFERYNLGGQVFFTYSSIDAINSSGKFEISTSLLNSLTGVTREGIFAYMNIEVDSNVIDYLSTDRSKRYFISAMYVNLDSSTVKNYTTGDEPEDGLAAEHLLIFGAMVGDIANSDSMTFNYGDPPHLRPFPDGRIDGNDILLFVRGWNGKNGVQDPIADIAPIVYWKGNNPPYMYSKPNGSFNADDIIAFAKMYSWYSSNFEILFHLDKNKLFKNDNSFYYDIDEIEQVKKFRLFSNGKKPIMGGELYIRVLNDSLKIANIKAEKLLKSDVSFPLVLNYETPNSILINFARLSKDFPEVSQSGEILSFDFTSLHNPDSLFLEIYLKVYDNSGNINYYSLNKDVIVNNDRYQNLLKVFPNPFSDVLNIRCFFKTSAKSNLKIYDISGSLVYTLFEDRFFNKGVYDFKFVPSKILSSGIYFILFNNGNYKQTFKIIYLK